MTSISDVRLQVFENAGAALVQIGYPLLHDAPHEQAITSSCNWLVTMSAPARMVTTN
jgi:hypothetical protein